MLAAFFMAQTQLCRKGNRLNRLRSNKHNNKCFNEDLI